MSRVTLCARVVVVCARVSQLFETAVENQLLFSSVLCFPFLLSYQKVAFDGGGGGGKSQNVLMGEIGGVARQGTSPGTKGRDTKASVDVGWCLC